MKNKTTNLDLSLSEKKDFLYDYCRMNKPELLAKILESSTEVMSITFEDGILFNIAISNKLYNVLNILLDYYKTTQLQSDTETIEYKLAQHKLTNILQEAINSYDISPTIQNLLKPYVNTNDDDSEQDLSGFEELEAFIHNESLGENQSTYEESTVLGANIHVH